MTVTPAEAVAFWVVSLFFAESGILLIPEKNPGTRKNPDSRIFTV
jgi:hypothetical protein